MLKIKRGMHVRAITKSAIALMLVCLLPACAKHEAGYAGAAADAALRSPEGAYLAYEHDVSIALAAKQIPLRLQAAQSACSSGKFGDCSVLNVSQQGGDHPSASLTVRIAPDGVEPLIAQASAGAEIGSRSTHAEDLAQAVRDNMLLRTRLEKEQVRLAEFQQRRDLSVADMIALSQQLSQVEAQLQVAQQEAAQHRRRIDTQRLTLRFNPPGGQSGRGEIRQAVRDFFATLATGTAWTIRTVAFLIPAVIGLAILLALWRRLRRKKT